MISNLSSGKVMHYSEVIGSESFGNIWIAPKITLRGMPSIIVPMGDGNISLGQIPSYKVYNIGL